MSAHGRAPRRSSIGPAGRPRPASLFAHGWIALLAPLVAPRDAPIVSAPPSLAVEIAGCAAVGAGPVCERPEDGALTLWIKTDPGARVTITLDGKRVAAEGTPVQGGTRVRVQGVEAASQLRVWAERGTAGRAWALPLVARSLPEVLRTAETLRRTRPADAEAIAQSMTAAPDDRARAAAVGIVARIRLARGKVDDAVAGLSEAAALNRKAGWPSDALRDESALAAAAIRARRFGEARAALQVALVDAAGVPGGGFRPAYYEGLLARNIGDFRGALAALTGVVDAAERIGNDEFQLSALFELSTVLQVIGRVDAANEAARRAEPLLANARDACVAADAWDLIGWLRSHAREDGDRHRSAEALEKAFDLRRTRCGGAAGLATVLTDLAVLALREGRDADAEKYLAEARRTSPEEGGDTRAWWIETEAELALRRGRPEESLRLFERLDSFAEAAVLPLASLRAAVGRARSLGALGRDEETGAAWETACERLVARSLSVSADAGRTAFVAAFEDVPRQAVTFFLRRDPARAARIARRSIGAAFAGLRWADRVAELSDGERALWIRSISEYREARDALEAEAGKLWSLPDDELGRVAAARKARHAEAVHRLDAAMATIWRGGAPGGALTDPGPDEAIVVMHPTDHGLGVMLVHESGAQSIEVAGVSADSPPETLAERLLGPFRSSMRDVRRLRFVVPASLDAIDFHALPWDGELLWSSFGVAYGVDFGKRASPPAPGAPRAAVIDDPRSDLPASRGEGSGAIAALRRAGAVVEELSGRAATHAAVVAALSSSPLDLFHYAGHGRVSAGEGLSAGAPLAQNGFLSAGDVLALPFAPRVVVLSGCELGLGATAGGEAALGFAQAFLAAGSQAVVASPRPVRDEVAARLMAALYASGGGPRDGGDAAERLRQGALALRKEHPDADWAAFRVLVP